MLFKDIYESLEIRYLVMPSFTPEYVFQIERNMKDKTFVSRLNKAKENIWYAKDKNKIRILDYSATINKEDVLLLSEVFRAIIGKTHYEPTDFIATDGISYYLSVDSYDKMGGKLWSPGDDMNLGVIAIIESLIDQLQYFQEEISLGQQARRQLQDYLIQLKKLPEVSHYHLLTTLKEFMDKNKSRYMEELVDSHKVAYGDMIVDFEKRLLLQFAFYILDTAYLNNMLDFFHQKLTWHIRANSDAKNKERDDQYVQKATENSIFMAMKRLIQ